MKQSINAIYFEVKEKAPLVQNITNYVVMNNTANALLALGASPIMAHAKSEVEDMVQIVSAVVINIGTLDEYWVEGMLKTAKKCMEIQKPWILDPVGAGATPFRKDVLGKLLEFRPQIIRGNASEIMSLSKANIKSKGVDSTHSSSEALDAGKKLAEAYDCIVCVSGEIDYVISKDRMVSLHNGHALMAKVTGMGCTASALIGAFAGVTTDYFMATVAAMGVMGVAGEVAAEKAAGPGTLQLHFYDALYGMEEHLGRIRVQEETEG